jgi:hypothetical protein
MTGACALGFVIGADGTVTSVDLGGCEVPPLLEGCLRTEFDAMRFPPPAHGGTIEVRYPFNVDPVL